MRESYLLELKKLISYVGVRQSIWEYCENQNQVKKKKVEFL